MSTRPSNLMTLTNLSIVGFSGAFGDAFRGGTIQLSESALSGKWHIIAQASQFTLAPRPQLRPLRPPAKTEWLLLLLLVVI